jgi:hypothetical protein
MDGQPRFLVDPKHSPLTSITNAKYESMTDADLVDLVGKQLVVVFGMPNPNLEFDVKGFQEVGSLEKPVTIHGAFNCVQSIVALYDSHS